MVNMPNFSFTQPAVSNKQTKPAQIAKPPVGGFGIPTKPPTKPGGGLGIPTKPPTKPSGGLGGIGGIGGGFGGFGGGSGSGLGSATDFIKNVEKYTPGFDNSLLTWQELTAAQRGTQLFSFEQRNFTNYLLRFFNQFNFNRFGATSNALGPLEVEAALKAYRR